MKRVVLTLILFAPLMTPCRAQDILTTKQGEDILAKVMEVGTLEIKYKKFDNQDGPVFTILKADVLMIRYENGTKDIFLDQTKLEPEVDKPSAAELYNKGLTDASNFYKGYKGAGTSTLVVGLLSPLIGLIPAIACSATPPKDQNLNYPSSELMKNPDYARGYKQRARGIKSKKIWKNWGIAMGVNIALTIALQAK